MDTGMPVNTDGEQQYGAYAGMHTPDSSHSGLATGAPFVQRHSPSLSPQPLLDTPRSPSVTDSTPTSPMMQHVQYVMQPDGTRQAVVMQPDGTQQPVMVQPDATQEQQVFLQPDGTQIVIQPDGSQLIMPPAGMPPAGMQEQHIVQDQTTGAHYMVSGGGQQVAGLQQQYAVPQQQQQEQQQPPPSYLHVKSEAPPPIVPPPSIFARPFFEQGSPTPKFWILLGAVLLIALAIGLGVGLGTRKKDCYSPDSVFCYYGEPTCYEIINNCKAYYCC